MAPLASYGGRIFPVIITDGGKEIRSAVEWLQTGYFSNKRSVTIRMAIQAVGLLYDFWAAQRTSGANLKLSLTNLLAGFGHALFYGTVNPDGTCPLGLNWKPRPSLARAYVAHAERFAIFCGGDAAAESLQANDGLAHSVSSAWQEVKIAGGILGHLRKARQLSPVTQSFSNPIGENYGNERPNPYPSELILKLITDGCRRDRKLTDPSLPLYFREYNVRDQLALCLIFGGGLRRSELFHQFSHDVHIHGDGRARVLLYHPSRGAIRWTPVGHKTEITGNRETYLREKFGIRPRYLYDRNHRLWAGWKNLLLLKGAPEYYTQVFWLQRQFENLFSTLHPIYVRYVLHRLRPNHPYYFVSLGSKTLGEPWTQNGFREAWIAAHARLGVRVSKIDGTNPHGARHWYGQTAADWGIDPRVRQVMMHHRNILSQLKYQSPSGAQIHATIQLAQDRMIRELKQNVDEANFQQPLEHLLYDASTASGADVWQWTRFRSDPHEIMNSWRTFQALVHV